MPNVGQIQNHQALSSAILFCGVGVMYPTTIHRLMIIIFFWVLQKFRWGEATPIQGLGMPQALMRAYSGTHRSPTKKDCWQRELNLGLTSEVNDPYQLNQPSSAMNHKF